MYQPHATTMYGYNAPPVYGPSLAQPQEMYIYNFPPQPMPFPPTILVQGCPPPGLYSVPLAGPPRPLPPRLQPQVAYRDTQKAPVRHPGRGRGRGKKYQGSSKREGRRDFTPDRRYSGRDSYASNRVRYLPMLQSREDDVEFRRVERERAGRNKYNKWPSRDGEWAELYANSTKGNERWPGLERNAEPLHEYSLAGDLLPRSGSRSSGFMDRLDERDKPTSSQLHNRASSGVSGSKQDSHLRTYDQSAGTPHVVKSATSSIRLSASEQSFETVETLRPEMMRGDTVLLELGGWRWPVHITLLHNLSWFEKRVEKGVEGSGVLRERGLSLIVKGGKHVVVKLPPAKDMQQLDMEELFCTREGRVEVGDMDRMVVETFVWWVYTAELSFSDMITDSAGNMYERELVDAEIIVRLWVFAARIGLTRLMNQCLKELEIRRRKESVVQTGMIDWIWERTQGASKADVQEEPRVDQQDKASTKDESASKAEGSIATELSIATSSGKDALLIGDRSTLTGNATWWAKQCPLRRLLIDQCAFKLDGGWIRTKEGHFPEDFLLEIMIRMREIIQDGLEAPFLTAAGMEHYFVGEN
jgi:hypothetical protein